VYNNNNNVKYKAKNRSPRGEIGRHKGVNNLATRDLCLQALL
jgi:hypothetical protein